jgi:hypothetical protein
VYNLKPLTTYQWRILTRCKITPDTLLSVYIDGPEFKTLGAAFAKSDYIESIPGFGERIFPMPVKDVATVELSHFSNDVKIELRDLNGNVLWQREHVTQKNISIPVFKLASGVYVVVIKDKEQTKVRKLIKA